RAPLFLIKQIIKKKPKAYVLRYLNDYPSFGKTLVRTASEVILILSCILFRIEIFWICHNIDRESDMYHPIMTNFRRKIVSFFSKKIFVTDELLVRKAIEVFPKHACKIESI